MIAARVLALTDEADRSAQGAIVRPFTLFLLALCLGLVVLCDPGAAGERALLLSGARWLTVIVFFYAGLQEVLYGTYFDAQFLGLSIGHTPTFAWLFGFLVPADEIARLAALHPLAPGRGPFAIHSGLAPLVSNGVYLFEMATPALLVWRRTRPYAAAAAVLVIAGIEAGARVPVELQSLSREQRRAIHSLRRRRSLWGTLASPARAGAALRAARPQADAVEVVVSKWYLDPATASIATHEETHRFAR